MKLKKVLCMLAAAVLLMMTAAAGADSAVIDDREDRGITIQAAGENTVPDGVSPTTGRTLSEIDVPDGFWGMASAAEDIPEQFRGAYMPLLVQVSNSSGGVKNHMPLYGSCADVVYESPKTAAGVTRFTMLFSDVLPEWVGFCRSARVQHIYIREEWNVPYLFFGKQSSEGNVTGTDVYTTIMNLGWRTPRATEPGARLFYDGTTGFKPWNDHCYRIKSLNYYDNVVYNAHGILRDVVAEQEFEPRNHTYLFSDTLPEGGDDAEIIYVTWNKNGDASGGTLKYYYNTMFEYDPDEGVYYRYMLTDRKNINANTVIPFTEATVSNVNQTGKSDLEAALDYGNEITFSNVIIQFVDITWLGEDGEMPLTTLTGSGNADLFMGGKHYAGVWVRETPQDRTVFYGEDGQEIPMQRGKTMIILMDHHSLREVRYE